MQRILITLMLATATIIGSNCVIGADKPSEKKETAGTRAIPFRGKIASVNKEANTLKIGERTFQVSPETRIIKAGKSATLDDASVGEDVGGSYREGTDKKLNVVSLRIGAKPETPAGPDDKK